MKAHDPMRPTKSLPLHDSPVRYRIAKVEELPTRGACVIHCGHTPIALFRTHDDRVYALEDRCPHRGGPLSEGIVHGHCVTCPLHDWVIALDTGGAEAPDHGTVRTFKVEVLEGEVFVDLPAPPIGIDACAVPRPG